MVILLNLLGNGYICSDSGSTTSTTDTNATSIEDDDASSAVCSSKIWECFTELLQEV